MAPPLRPENQTTHQHSPSARETSTMFNFLTSQNVEEQASSVAAETSDGSSTMTTFSDLGSLLDPLVPRRTVTPEQVPKRRMKSSAIGLSDQRIARQQRPLLELMDRLRSLGVQFDLDLPQIVVVGPQNVGKSSLIEGICGVKLPRASGTCTRCPIELCMKCNADIWRCDISLQIICDENGMLGQAQSIAFGNPIFKPDEVEERVRRAQRAVLCPSVHPETFLRGTESDSTATELSFSKNYISLQIQGPDIADLSFVDLPGLIASARLGKESDISLIEDLVTSYIEKPSTLILLTVACEADFETQGAHKLVKKYDRNGTRTIGVLTKPDRIATGDEGHWARFILYEEEQLDLGWFIVKQPDKLQLSNGLSWHQAREAEMKWFQSTEPWSEFPSKYSNNLGTGNLVKKLGETLACLIARRLPDLREELEDAIRQTERELQKLPMAPCEDSLTEMMRRIAAFCYAADRDTEGVLPRGETGGGFINSINVKQREFRRSILSFAPRFRPYKKSESFADAPPRSACELLEGDIGDEAVSASGLIMFMDEAMDLLKRSITRELPDYSPYEVTERVIQRTMERWDAAVFIYLDAVQDIIVAHYKQLVEAHFKYFETGGLLNVIQMEVQSLIKQHRDETGDRLKWLLQLEMIPFTRNERTFLDYKTKFLRHYKLCRSNMIKGTPAPAMQIQMSNFGPSRGVRDAVGRNVNIGDVTPLDLLAESIPNDETEPALKLMATVSAYFHLACKRFTDIVPMAVDLDFVKGVSDNLQTALTSSVIKDDAQGRCKSLLQESSVVAAKRQKLQRKLERLEATRSELLNMPWRDFEE